MQKEKEKAGGRSTDLRKKELQEEEEGKEEYWGEEEGKEEYWVEEKTLRQEGLLMDVLKISPPLGWRGGCVGLAGQSAV